MMDFAERLKKLRKRKGLSQVALADRLGLSKSTIGAYETGDITPSLEVLNLIADYFNVGTDYLLGKETGSTYYTASKDIRMILDALYLLYKACENIKALGGCDRCPMASDCLEITSVLTLAEEVTARQYTDFLAFSDDIEEYKDEQDYVALQADQARKMEAEERMIDDWWY